MNEVVTPPAEAPAAAPAAAPAPATSPAPAPVAESLFSSTAPAAPAAAPPAAAPADQPPAADVPTWLPEKYRVMGADGALDLAASSQKLADGYAAATKRIGTGDLPPETPDGYKFTPPEEYKDVPLDENLSKPFRERAHKAGLTPSQYEFVMGEYFALVPSLLNGAAKATADEARNELQKVWATPADLSANMSAAERAVANAPEALREQVKAKYGTDPLFWQFAAHYGRQMSEDRPPGSTPPAAQASDIETMMRSEAYRNPKHPEHAAVSARVAAAHRARYGEQPVV